MSKIPINANTFPWPMPVVLVGTLVNDKANFMAVAWVSRVNYNPPLIAVALGKGHHSNKGIIENNCFSVNVPSVEMVKETDYCGLVSGKDEDKSKLFEVFYGELKTAPMIKDCPVTMACGLSQTVDLGMDTLFIGEIVSAFSENKYLSNGNPDLNKIRPFMLAMPGNDYCGISLPFAKAWSSGKELAKTQNKSGGL